VRDKIGYHHENDCVILTESRPGLGSPGNSADTFDPAWCVSLGGWGVVVVELPATVVVLLVGVELGTVVVGEVGELVVVVLVIVDVTVDVLAVVLVEDDTGTVVVVCAGVDVEGVGALVVGGLMISPRGPM
jgi:hypothetical protein